MENSEYHINEEDIAQLERELRTFENSWEDEQQRLTIRWRFILISGLIGTLLAVFFFPAAWWVGLALVGYSAGSLFRMLKDQSQTTQRLNEHRDELRLARLLLEHHSDPGWH